MSVAGARVGRGGQQAGEGLAEHRLGGMARDPCLQSVPSFLVAPEEGERHRVSEPGLGTLSIGGDHPVVLGERFVRPPHPPQEASQPDAGLDVARLVPHRGRVPVERLLEPAVSLQEQPEAVVRLGVLRRYPQGRFELCSTPALVAQHEQRRSQPVPQRRVLGRQLDAPAEGRRRGFPVSAGECLNPLALVGARTAQRVPHGLHQRVGPADLAAAPLLQVYFGPLHLAQTAVGQPERIVDIGGPRIHRQGCLQMLHGLQVVLSHHGRPSQADPRPDRVGPQRQRLCQQRFGRRGPALFQLHLAERDQGRHVVRLQCQGLLEGRRGLREGAAGRVQVAEVVRPAPVVRRQRLRVAVEGLGRVDVARRGQHVAHRAVRFAQRAGLVRTLDGRRQRRVSLADLVPHGGSHVGEIG